MEEWTLKLIEQTRMVKLTTLLRDNNLIKFLATWGPQLDFVQGEKSIWIFGITSDLIREIWWFLKITVNYI